MEGFAPRAVPASELERWVSDLKAGDVVLHARRARSGERRSLRFRDPVATWTLAPDADPRPLLADLDAALAAGTAIAGYLAYEAAAPLVGLAPAAAPPYPLAWFGAYRAVETIDPDGPGTALAAPRDPGGTICDVRLACSRDAWHRRVESVRAALAAGDSYQVNLTTAFDVRVADVREAYRALSASQPVPFGALLDTGALQLASCSPELFFRSEPGRAGAGPRITTRPMKGTLPRLADPAADAAAAESLRRDAKSRAENVMIVDLLRHDLGRLARPGSVEVRDLLAVERYRAVWQMTSTVTAEALPGTTLGAALSALFPCGSVTGAPKRRTMELIAALEDAPRGAYTGAIGYALPSPGGVLGHSVWNVAIRTLVVRGGEGRLGVGGGILIDSDPDAEWAELAAKGRFLTHPRGPVGLFETMRWEAGSLRRWPRHRARMAASAAYWDLPFDAAAAESVAAAAVREALAADPGAASGPLRVRLDLTEEGLSATARPHPPDVEPAIVAWSDLPIDADDPARRHKGHDRRVYDDASAWARAHGLADVLFCNRGGRVAEGAISNVFAWGSDGRWRTPPLADGALPGVLRAALLDEGRAVEASLTPADLEGTTLAIGNALRGLRPAVLDPVRRWRPT